MKRAWALCGLVCAVLAGCADRDRKANADGMLMLSRTTLDFNKVALHSARELTLTLSNIGRGPINVYEIWTEGPEGTFKAEFTHEGPHRLITGSDCMLKVRFRPRTGGDLGGTLVIVTDNRDTPQARVPLVGFGIDARAKIEAPSFDFGRIEAESHKSIAFTVENPSPIPVDVLPRVHGVDKDEFQVPLDVTLQPGERRTLELTFSPRRVSKKVAVFTVRVCRGCGDEIYNVRAEALDRAVLALPADVDFGQIPIDRTAEQKARLVNISTEPMTLQQMVLAPGTDPSFTADMGSFPVVLAPGETREWPLHYSPGHMGIAEGQVVFSVQSQRNPTTAVAMRAFGGSPELCISPLNYDFGKVPVGAKVSLVLNIKNCGSSNGDPLQVQEIVFGGSGPSLPGEDQFNLVPPQLPRTLAAGEEMTVKAFFEPSRPGHAAATLNVRSSAFAAAHLKVGVSGEAETHAPCNVAITPSGLDFGNVPPTRGAVLGVKVENRGMDLCAVKNIQLAENGGGVFRMPGGALDGFILNPGSFFSFMVAFNPPAGGGAYSGALQVMPADPSNPLVLIPLVGASQSSCLTPTPRFIDFGVARPDCPAAPLRTNLANTCTTPLTLESIEIGAGTTDGEFRISNAPSVLPHTLNPGDAVSVEVEYRGLTRGLNLSPLYLRMGSEPIPLLVPLVGESSFRAEQTDRFIQQDGSKVDVLFVVDNTESMVEEHPLLNSALPTFVNEALSRNVDLHIAVTTTGIEPASNACPGGAQGGEAGRLFPANGTKPRLLTSSTPNLAAALQANAQVGRCAFVEKGFEAVRRALSAPLVDHSDDPRTPLPQDGNFGFLRDEAALAVVFVGDEDDHSPDDVDTYVRFLQSKKGVGQPQRATIYAIAPTSAACSTAGGTGTRYAQAAQKTGGDVMSICASDYSPLMQSLAQKAFSPQDRFPLSALPDPTSFEVTINGAPVTSGWTYDTSANAVVFNPEPAAGAKVDIKYRKACPN